MRAMDELLAAACNADRDRALRALDDQFNVMAAEMLVCQRAYLARVAAAQRADGRHTEGEDARRNSLLLELESILDRMDPIGRAIIAAAPGTVQGAAIQARYAAFLLSHYWSEPIERMDLQRRRCGC